VTCVTAPTTQRDLFEQPSCSFRLRRKVGAGWERRSLVAEPRSAYLLRGASRTEWEHSIPPLATLRYSITFRSMARRHARRAKQGADAPPAGGAAATGSLQ
jgi:hypothetical protein